MPDAIIYKDFETRAKATAYLANFEADGWQGEVIDEGDGTWSVKIWRPEATVAATARATNMGAMATDISTGAPSTGLETKLRPILDFIGEYEAAGNYNAYFRNSGNQNNPKFTQKTLKSVIDWQRNHVNVNQSPSSAVGKYQFIRRTLEGLISALGLNTQDRFTSGLQDRLAIKLMEEKGLSAYLAGTKSEVDFANDLAKVWASLPVVTAIKGARGTTLSPGDSYYAGDGLNTAHADIDGYQAALRAIV